MNLTDGSDVRLVAPHAADCLNLKLRSFQKGNAFVNLVRAISNAGSQ